MRVSARLLALLAAGSLGLTACGGPGASPEALVDILVAETGISDDEAQCVSDALYADPGFTEDEINQLSVIRELADDASDTDRAKFERYEIAVDTAVRRCV